MTIDCGETEDTQQDKVETDFFIGNGTETEERECDICSKKFIKTNLIEHSPLNGENQANIFYTCERCNGLGTSYACL